MNATFYWGYAMKAKFFAGLLLSLAAAVAQAGPSTYDLPLVGQPDGSLVGGLSSSVGESRVTHTTTGYFEDIFNFSYSGTGMVTLDLSANFALVDMALQGIRFDRISLNGIDVGWDFMDAGGTRFLFGGLYDELLAGDYQIKVSGWAGDTREGNSVPSTISASYSGILTVIPQRGTVPEPSALLLAGLGLGSMALVRRRRRDD